MRARGARVELNYCSVKQRVILVNAWGRRLGGRAAECWRRWLVFLCVCDFNLTLQVNLIFRAVHQHWADWIQAVVVTAAERTGPRFRYLRKKEPQTFKITLLQKSRVHTIVFFLCCRWGFSDCFDLFIWDLSKMDYYEWCKSSTVCNW